MGDMSERQRRAVEAALAQEDAAAAGDQRILPPPPAQEPAAVQQPRVRAPRGPGESPNGIIIIGFTILFAGGVLLGIGFMMADSDNEFSSLVTFAGVVVAVVGQLIAMVGVIAAGVRLGMRWHLFDQQRR